MRAVTIALAALSVVVGGACLTIVLTGADPLAPLNAESEDASSPPGTDPGSGPAGSGSARPGEFESWASESWVSETSVPTSSTGTPIDGRRPHLSVIDGRANAYLPVPLPEIVSLLPTAASELAPLPPTPLAPPGSAGSAGGSDNRGAPGEDRNGGGHRNEGREEAPSNGGGPKRENVPPAAGPAPAPAPGRGPDARPGAEPAPAPDPVKLPPLTGRSPAVTPPVPTAPRMWPSVPGTETEPPRKIQDPRGVGDTATDESRSINASGTGDDVVEIYAQGPAGGAAERDSSGEGPGAATGDATGGAFPTDGTDDLAALATPEAQPAPVATEELTADLTDDLTAPAVTGAGTEESDGSHPDPR